MNATGLAFDRDGMLYVSSRYDGIVYQVTPNGNSSCTWKAWRCDGAWRLIKRGIYTSAIAVEPSFKISPRARFTYSATIEPSIAAYHLAFGPMIRCT